MLGDRAFPWVIVIVAVAPWYPFISEEAESPIVRQKVLCAAIAAAPLAPWLWSLAVGGRRTRPLRFENAEEAIKAADPAVGLLAQADDGGSGSAAWVDNMFAAVPDLGQLAAGWTVHPYGTTWQEKIDELIAATSANGVPSTIPIYATEWGLATDDGRCLSDNDGWNPCMTYSEAARTASSVIASMRARYGTRLHAFYFYQAQDQEASGASTNREGCFGILQKDGAAKGAYTTEVESLLAANP